MSNPDQRTAVARAIWAVMREHEDRCDMELEDNGSDEPIWQYADAALAGLSPYEPCYVCGRPMDGLSDDDCHCFHFKQLRSVATTEAAAMAATVPAALTDLFCQAMAWGAVYHPIVATSQWDKLRDDMAANFVKLAAQAPVAGQPAEPSPADPIRGLLQAHEDLIEQGENYAYFELAYTRRTGWMAWLTDRPASGEPGTAEYAKSRKVIAQGQGDSAEEACQDALDVMAAPKGDSNG